MSFLLGVMAAVVCLVVLIAFYDTIATNVVGDRADSVTRVPAASTERDAWLRTVAAAAGSSVTSGNSVTVLQNGAAIFPAMLAAIAGAHETVHLSTYVFWSGAVADAFAGALCAAARRGVTVRVIVDREGSGKRLDPALVRRMRDAGCRVAWYHRAQWFDVLQYDHRTHRRLLIVDGRVAFTGGAGIADQWEGDAGTPAHWRDTHARLEGPAAAGLQAGFTESWSACTGELLLEARDYPPLEPHGRTDVAVVVSTPAGGGSPAERTMAACIASASRHLRITNAYFVPTPAFVCALRAAADRGVSVQVIVPGPYHNKPLVRRASRHVWHTLLDAGVQLHEHQRTMVHAKTVIVDSVAALVGTINFDPRSFTLNAESGVIVADPAMAEAMTLAFERDLAGCAPVNAAALHALSPLTRLGDACCYWFRAQL